MLYWVHYSLLVIAVNHVIFEYYAVLYPEIYSVLISGLVQSQTNTMLKYKIYN